MRLGIISDEVDSDLRRAFEAIASWELRHVELRQAWGKNIVQLDEVELARTAELLEEFGLEVTAIASPVFKSPLDEQPRQQSADFALEGVETMTAQIELLERACALAKRFATRFVRVFTFWREPWSDEITELLVQRFERAAEVARQHGVTLAVENEPVCMVGTGRELGRLCRQLEMGLPEELRKHVGALWDPGNALAGGETDPYPGGYEGLHGCRLVHVHLKDVAQQPDGSPAFVPLGQGEVDYRQQLERLQDDDYDGLLVLEPHYAPPNLSRIEAARSCVTAARSALQAVTGPGA